jgi:hypothetical protein
MVPRRGLEQAPYGYDYSIFIKLPLDVMLLPVLQKVTAAPPDFQPDQRMTGWIESGFSATWIAKKQTPLPGRSSRNWLGCPISRVLNPLPLF